MEILSHIGADRQHERRPKPTELPLLVRSEIDELGLSPTQFRVYSHICRREQLTAAGATTAAICCISPNTLWHTLKKLEAFGMIRRIRHGGRTSPAFGAAAARRCLPHRFRTNGKWTGSAAERDEQKSSPPQTRRRLLDCAP